MSNFMEKIKERAKEQIKTIVLPEGEDIRTITAADIILREEIANLIILGDEEKIAKLAKGKDISRATIINPLKSNDLLKFADNFYEIRKSKGVTPEQALETVKNPLYYGVMLVKLNIADGMVAGAVNSTPDVLRPSLQILKTAPGTKLVSAFFVMCVPDCAYGHNGTFIFADSGLNENPDAEAVSEIAISSAASFEQLVGAKAKIAMLSYSTMGSAKSELVDKMQLATKLAKQKRPDLALDGELQADAAIVPEIGKSKAPNSTVAGSANVLVFPDLNAGNIGYKLVQRLAKAEAYGPITQGIAKPVNDLSRGCNADDIVGVVAITCVQAQKA
ncbi:MAG: Phosphate acetyltransferase [Firmicutes bacterium ADurb.Bin193]|nr:MAG: Phosphate acetyltransferase [Firmicutes bacterium ADurb.Bin193]